MCQICNNQFEGLRWLDCSNCSLLTSIPNIGGLEHLNCSNCPSLTSIPIIENLAILECANCPLLTNIPNIEGLGELNCSNCSILNNIPNFKNLKDLDCSNCLLLYNIPNIINLKTLNCHSCPLLTNIHNNNKLRNIYCDNCPSLMYIPNIINIRCDRDLFKCPFEKSKYLTNKKMNKLYNNIFKLWKLYKLRSYALYLEREIYSNPRLPYMKYYINNVVYNNSLDNISKFRIGFINKENKLIWYTI